MKGVIKVSEDKLDLILEKIDGLDNRMENMESRQDEMYKILRGLEERTKVNSAKLDNIEHDVAEVKGEARTLEAVTKENLFDIAKLKSDN